MTASPTAAHQAIAHEGAEQRRARAGEGEPAVEREIDDGGDGESGQARDQRIETEAAHESVGKAGIDDEAERADRREGGDLALASWRRP